MKGYWPAIVAYSHACAAGDRIPIADAAEALCVRERHIDELLAAATAARALVAEDCCNGTSPCVRCAVAARLDTAIAAMERP